jgi:hypothetical protein
MTDPTAAKQVKLGSGKTARRYSWPPHPPHEFTVTSVTSATKGGLPAPHLIGWAAKTAAECAVDDHDLVSMMISKGQTRAAIDHIKGSRFRSMNEKADRGTIVHAALEAYLNGKPFTKEEITDRLKEKRVPRTMWKSTEGMVRGVFEFLGDSEIDVYWAEHTLYNRTHQYAGTADVLGRLYCGGGMNNGVVDVKTSKAIYDEVGLQLVAYARAEFVGLGDGTEMPLIPKPASKSAKAVREWKAQIEEGFRFGVVVRPKANGTYERGDFSLTDDLFDMFLSTLRTTQHVDNETMASARRPNAH